MSSATPQRLNELAQRWIKAWWPGSYSHAEHAHFRSDGRIWFHHNTRPSGINYWTSMPGKYAEDDSSLEADSRQWYLDDCKARSDKSEKIRSLKARIEVMPEFKELSDLYYADKDYFCHTRIWNV